MGWFEKTFGGVGKTMEDAWSISTYTDPIKNLISGGGGGGNAPAVGIDAGKNQPTFEDIKKLMETNPTMSLSEIMNMIGTTNVTNPYVSEVMKLLKPTTEISPETQEWLKMGIGKLEELGIKDISRLRSESGYKGQRGSQELFKEVERARKTGEQVSEFVTGVKREEQIRKDQMKTQLASTIAQLGEGEANRKAQLTSQLATIMFEERNQQREQLYRLAGLTSDEIASIRGIEEAEDARELERELQKARDRNALISAGGNLIGDIISTFATG